MKRFVLLILVFVSTVGLQHVFGQQELANIYLAKTSIAGGTPDGGTSTTRAYTFVAKQKLEMVHVLYEEKALILKKGDTLVINLNSFEPYSRNILNQNDNEVKYEKPKPQKQFDAYFRKNKYYVNTRMDKEFEFARTYKVKGKKHIAQVKTKVDSEQQHAAP